MKTQISPAMAAGIIAVLVLVLGFAAWRSFSGPPAVDPNKIPAGFPGSAHMRVAPGQLPPGVAPPGGAPASLLPQGQANGQSGTPGQATNPGQ